MATTQEILTAAKDLGKLIAKHQAVVQLEKLTSQLQADVEAQRLLTDLNRHLQALGEKEAAGQPIEVADKHKLDDLQKKVISHPLLGQLQMTQMDYLDLMRQVDDAISPAPGNAPGSDAGAADIGGGILH